MMALTESAMRGRRTVSVCDTKAIFGMQQDAGYSKQWIALDGQDSGDVGLSPAVWLPCRAEACTAYLMQARPGYHVHLVVR